jgi:hypothetical protein
MLLEAGFLGSLKMRFKSDPLTMASETIGIDHVQQADC